MTPHPVGEPDRTVRAGYTSMWLVWLLALVITTYVIAPAYLAVATILISPAYELWSVTDLPQLYLTYLESPTLFYSLYAGFWWSQLWLAGAYIASYAIACYQCCRMLLPYRPPSAPQPVTMSFDRE